MHPDNKKQSNYGNWRSEISADLVVADSVSLDETRLANGTLYYIERRPHEDGRCVIVSVTDKKHTDILPAPYSARSRVHEYGGGCYCVADDLLFFINDSDQDIYLITNGKISRITCEDNKRFADFCYDRRHKRLISVCETHDQQTVSNSIVEIDVQTGNISPLEQGCDFYASPKLNSNSSQLAWQSWQHPNMPWDGNTLCLGNLDDRGKIATKKDIAGSDNVSIFQPQWSPDDILYYISDITDWWHLYRYLEITESTQQLTDGEKEFGLPQWVFAQSTYAFIDDHQLICRYQSTTWTKTNPQTRSTLALLSINPLADESAATLSSIDTPWQEFSAISAAGNTICFIAASAQCSPQLISAHIDNSKHAAITSELIKTSSQIPVSSNYFSTPKNICFNNRHQQPVFANYYPPTNPEYHAKKGDSPPLIVICHGGPTGQASIALDPKKQFWTSRGFALLDVNYSGSTGYGKNYRLRLNDKWGELDVQDCCDAALYAVEQNLADKDHLIIRGSSAGGFTVLAALTFEKVFSAGASYYGISELTSLANDTHKFESRYLDRLIGPYPEAEELYQKRSPINHSDELDCPVIFFQGIDDRVVPKQQAELMFEALDKKGLAVAAQYYEGEQHGFRKAATIIQSLENELSFYQLIFEMKPKSEIHFKGDICIKNTK